MIDYLISCDWGTSSFRLRLLNKTTQTAIKEVVSPAGVAFIYKQWINEAAGVDRLAFYTHYLKTQIDALSLLSGLNLDRIPIVISGMASSSIGMYELPYSNVPFDMDGRALPIHFIAPTAIFAHDIFLISGVKTEYDVMRGEETQLVGMAELLKLSAHKTYRVVLPGTHSKHLYIHNNHITDFQTYMTGELFNIVATHSILKDSIDGSSLKGSSQQEMDAFILGVKDSETTSLLQSLFRVRTNQIFQKMTKSENAHFLSGVFIGSELKELLGRNADEIIVCCAKNLHTFYKTALNALQLQHCTTVVEPDVLEQATIMGQIKIFQNQTVTLSH